MTSPQPEILYGFFCEFIRLEMSGQISPVGIWGESCRIGANAPAVLPAIAFHAFIRNPGHVTFKAKIRISLPGKNPPVEVETVVNGNPLQSSHFLNINMMAINIQEPGDVVAQVHLEVNPPVEREFRLQIDFQPNADPQMGATPKSIQ